MRIDEMIELAKEQLTGHPNQPKEPLIRLRIHYSDENHMFNPIRFGHQYTGQVANPSDIIAFKKVTKRSKAEQALFDTDAMKKVFAEVKCMHINLKCEI